MSCSHRSALCSLAGGSLYISVVVWTDPLGCINARCVQVNWWVPITSSRSISSLEDRAITSTPAKSDVVVFRGRYSAPAFFNLLRRCNPTHLGFFKFTYRLSYNSANRSFTYSVCWITRRESFLCVKGSHKPCCNLVGWG